MAEDCEELLAGEFARQCSHKPKQGVSKKWYFNWDDIDQEATNTVNKGTKIDALVLKANAKIYKAQGGSKSKKVKHALSVGDYGNGYIHTDELIVEYVGEKEAERIQELVLGARIVSINKMVDTGINGETSYKVAGLESGMQIINDDFDSTANSGTTTLIVATNEGEEEFTRLKIFLMPADTVSDPNLTELEATEAWIEENTYVAV